MIKRRKMRLNGEWQQDSRNQVYELKQIIDDILVQKLEGRYNTETLRGGSLRIFF